MKRALLTLALFACGPSDPSPIGDRPDAGSVTIQLIDGPITVVAGESTRVRVLTSPPAPVGVTVGFATLPPGVSASTLSWPLDALVVPTLDVSAAPDAVQTELTVELRATKDGTIVGTQSVRLSVSNVAGSLDPSFGTGGSIDVGARKVVGIESEADGSYTVAGVDSTLQFFLGHVSADGDASGFVNALPSGMKVYNVDVAAFAPDGRVFFGVALTTGSALVVLDSTGNVLSSKTLSITPSQIVLDGDAMFVSEGTTVLHLDATQTVDGTLQLPFGIAALQSIGPGVVLAGGDTRIAKLAFDGQTISVDTSYGTSGFATVASTPQRVTALALAPDGTTLAAVTDPGSLDMFRVAPDGSVIATGALPTFQTNKNAGRWVFMPNDGSALLVGTTLDITTNPVDVIARFGASGPLDTAFGTYGRVFSSVATSLSAAVLDSVHSRACVAGLDPTVANTTKGYFTCYRLK